MNRLNRIFHNKQIKLFWFLRSFARYLTPKRLLQSRLDRVLAEAERRPDWEYICRRADYYNKLSPAPATPPREGLRPLGDHKFRRGVKTAYFFDTYEFTRWFSDRLLWNTVPGDVTTVPDVPSIVKSRPICGDNANSVLLNLDKVRHFIFLRDDIPFRKKSDKAIFRLAITRRPHRERFMRMYFGSECCDAGISTPRPEYPPEWTKPHISMYDHLNYKFILAIEGYDVATNLKWIMSSNSLAVMPRPTYETWFMEGTLIPGYHYVEIRPDYSDLEERMRYYIEHPDEAEAIIAHAHEYVAQFRDRRREKIISLLVLQNYFRRTGQHDVQQDAVVVVCGDLVERRGVIGGLLDDVLLPGQRPDHDLPQGGFVFNNEYLHNTLLFLVSRDRGRGENPVLKPAARHRPPKPVFQTGEITARIRKETEMPGISAARCAGNNSARPAVK